MKSSRKSPIAERWVVNASPVIALARIGRTDLLTALPRQVCLPKAAAEEILHAPEHDPARRVVESGAFRIVQGRVPPPEILAWDLGQGEAAVLTWAYAHPRYVAILDETGQRAGAPAASQSGR